MEPLPQIARVLVAREAAALLARLETVAPFATKVPMVLAAGPPIETQRAIERHLAAGRRELGRRVRRFLRWLASGGRDAPPQLLQRQLALLRLRFNAVLAELDVFADALTQRSEHGTGVLLAGLDLLARDGLAVPGGPPAPPVICYLDRGIGAAIRRVRVRLPGGSANPVALVSLPRERMLGTGVASSLLHEVGHQGSALLELLPSLRPIVGALARARGADRLAWRLHERWLSEELSDFWAVARIGIAAPLGLLAVVSLPAPFVYQVRFDDPHPSPWARVRIACAFGRVLYPDPQWDALSRTWAALYPTAGLPAAIREVLELVDGTAPALAELVARHRVRRLAGRSLGEALSGRERSPCALRALWRRLGPSPVALSGLPPTLAFAAVGQARADGALGARAEGALLGTLLERWAVADAVGEGPGVHEAPAAPRRPARMHAVA